MARIAGAWPEDSRIDGWIGKGASGHAAALLQAKDVPQIVQPA